MAQNPDKLPEKKEDMSTSHRQENPVDQQPLQNPNKKSEEKPIISEEFQTFHEIDRQLFKHLVVTLKRNVKDSVHFLAFWMWLERDVVHDLNLINRMLDSTPRIVTNLADETNLCLQCVESDVFMCPESGHKELYYVRVFTKRDITFRYLFDNRVEAVRGISKMVEEVCFQAFHDIIKAILSVPSVEPSLPFQVAPGPNLSKPKATTQFEPNMRKVESKRPKDLSHTAPPFVPVVRAAHMPVVHNTGIFSARLVEVYDANINPGRMPFTGALAGMVFPSQQQGVLMPPPVVNLSSPTVMHWVPIIQMPPPIEENRSMVQQNNRDNWEFHSYFDHKMEYLHEEEPNHSYNVDDRTIFITFSKGYPISEDEVWDFFTSTFGDIIESVHMQEVQENEQVLYATLVARSVWAVNAVVGDGTTKYLINGKHCKVRRFMRKVYAPSADGAGPSYTKNDEW